MGVLWKYLLLGAILGVCAAIFDWPRWVIWVFLLLLFLQQMGSLVYLNSITKNLKSLSKFFEKNKRNPIYHYLYIYPTAKKEELIDALQDILSRYKNDKYAAVYGTQLALLQNDMDTAKKANEPILHTEIGQYSEQLIDILSGKEVALKTFKKQWMNDSLKAHQAFVQRDLAQFDHFTSLSLKNVGGVQYYGNYYAFEKMRTELQNN